MSDWLMRLRIWIGLPIVAFLEPARLERIKRLSADMFALPPEHFAEIRETLGKLAQAPTDPTKNSDRPIS